MAFLRLAMIAALLMGTQMSNTASALPFSEDDFAARRAATKDKPLVVDLWAPWCHSCLSMKNYVLVDRSLDSLASKAVFVAIDTDKEANKEAVDLLKPTAWPTFVVVDPKDGAVLARLIGSATAPAFAAFVEEGIAAYHAKKNANKPAASVQADALLSAGDKAGAAAQYALALQDKGLQPLARGRIASSYVYALSQLDDPNTCEAVASRERTIAKGTYYEALLLAAWFDCANESTVRQPTVEVIKQAASELQALIEDKRINYTADDKSDLYATLAEMHERLNDKTAAQSVRLRRLDMLEKASAAATSKEAARTFDAHRAELYLDLGRADEAIAMLLGSEKDSPKDYNPPARLARAYLAKGLLSEAKAAIARANALAYGPRRAVLWSLEGDIDAQRGKKEEARAMYQKAYTLLSQQPQTPGTLARMKQLEKRIAE